MSQRPRTLLSLLVLSSMLLASAAVSAPSARALAERLVSLRSKVEALAQELELRRVQQREEIVALAQRKAEVEADTRREELRLRRLEAALAEQQASAVKTGALEQELAPVVLSAGAALRAHVGRGIPFQLEQRLAAIDDVTAALEAGQLTPNKAALRMWALHQDEARLVKESGLYRQAIELDGERVLAEVARIGMVLLFFKAPDGVVGRARKHGEVWRYERLTSEPDVRRAEQLFDAFKKQLRTGWFELPAALSDLAISDDSEPGATHGATLEVQP